MKEKNSELEFILKIKCKWSEMSIADYQEYVNTMEDDNMDLEEKGDALIALISGLNYTDVRRTDLGTYRRLLEDIKFLNKPIDNHKIVHSKIKIGDKKFKVIRNISDVLTGQYQDFQFYYKQTDKYTENLPKMLALFIIPDAHQYDDGYDLNELIEYIRLNMCIEDALSFFYYLETLSIKLLKVSLKYLKSETKKKK